MDHREADDKGNLFFADTGIDKYGASSCGKRRIKEHHVLVYVCVCVRIAAAPCCLVCLLCSCWPFRRF